jgi:uncharacterized protein (DUF2147 family)
MKYILLSFILIFSIGANAQDIIGKWKTIDDNTGKARSIVEIYKKGDKVFGKVVKLFREPGEDPDPVCEECSGKKKNQKVIGMEIITDMVFDADDNEYDKGEILDPENGKVYDCKLWVEDGKLKVRGYLYFLYRTQTWLPAE